MATVVVNPAGMVHRALAQRDLGDEVAFRVDLEEVPDALPDIPIVAFSKLRVALRRPLKRGSLTRARPECLAFLL